jgi:hypothetical protein
LLPWLPWDAFFRVFDAPLPALAVPGFVGGTLFSLVLGLAGRRQRFSDLSLARFTAWGALGGVLLSLVPTTMVLVGLATLAPTVGGPWKMFAIICGPLALLSAASASGSLMLARRAEDLDERDTSGSVATSGLEPTRDNALLPASGVEMVGPPGFAAKHHATHRNTPE